MIKLNAQELYARGSAQWKRREVSLLTAATVVAITSPSLPCALAMIALIAGLTAYLLAFNRIYGD